MSRLTKRSHLLRAGLSAAMMSAMAVGGITAARAANPCAPRAANPCAPRAANPCAAKANPCAANPCAAKMNPCAANPCAAKAANPCAAKANPCAAKPNPCAANPCAAKPMDKSSVLRPAGTKLASGDHAALVKQGATLFQDTSLSTNGLSCISCHEGNGAFAASFAEPYPHPVSMAQERGIDEIALDEMVQLCMVVPMEAKPLPWDSQSLAALTAYTAELQKDFKPN